jgi:hypothetical protein
MSRLGYRKDDYLVETDGVGILAHRSECVKQYDGKLKLKKNLDPRHPQEFLRMRKDKQSVPDPRPVPPVVEKFSTDTTIL